MPIKIDAYALIQDQKAANTDGGGFTSGAYRTRDLNTEVVDADGIVSISSNQFTLGAGTYYIRARAPAYSVQEHKAKLRNVTDSTDALIGSSEHSFSSNETWSEIQGAITLAGSKTFEIQHRCTTTINTNGFGVRSNFSAVEVYTSVEIWRIVSVSDSKLSNLTALTSLDGTEEFVVNDSGTSKKITADDMAVMFAGVVVVDGGQELAYVEQSGNVTINTTTSASANDLVSSGTITYDGSTRICIEYFAPTVEVASGGFIELVLYDGSTEMGLLGDVASTSGSNGVPSLVRYFLTPSAGSHEYKIKAFRGGGNGTIYSGDGSVGNFVRGYVRITEISGSSQTPGEFVGAKAYNDATQNINNTTAAVTFNQEEFDSDGFHSTSSNTSRFTIPSGFAGKYLIQGGTLGSGAADWIGFRKNGSTALRGYQTANTGGAFYRSATTVVDLAVGDYVELLVSTTSNINVGHASLPDAQSWMAVTRMVGTALNVNINGDPIFDLFGTPDTAFEFNTTSLSGLTALASTGPSSEDANTTIPGHYWMKGASSDGGWMGRYIQISPPFTMITLVRTSGCVPPNYIVGGFIGASTPGNMQGFGLARSPTGGPGTAGFLRYGPWTSPTNATGANTTYPLCEMQEEVYIATVVRSSTDFDLAYSFDGKMWVPIHIAANPGITVGSAGVACLTGSGLTQRVAWDYIRYWNSAKTIPGLV